MTRSTAVGVALLDLLQMEPVGADDYRCPTSWADPYPLYGGQVAAQALMAAGATVPAERLPHSLHGYFLRPGDAAAPMLFRVHRDRDGRSFSARRVEVLQDGAAVFTMSTSFQTPEDGLDRQAEELPDAGDPEALAPGPVPRLLSFEARYPPQPHGTARWPTRFWTRSAVPLPDDPLVHACALVYVSDIMSGLSPLAEDGWRPMTSLDHAVWFHRPARLDGWTLVDATGRSTGGGRGWYQGTISSADGTLLASIAQESLFRRRSGREG